MEEERERERGKEWIVDGIRRMIILTERDGKMGDAPRQSRDQDAILFFFHLSVDHLDPKASIKRGILPFLPLFLPAMLPIHGGGGSEVSFAVLAVLSPLGSLW